MVSSNNGRKFSKPLPWCKPRRVAGRSGPLNNIDSDRYLRYVLTRIAEHSINRIEELLPWTIAPSLSKMPPTA
jgi:hypothetical protein